MSENKSASNIKFKRDTETNLASYITTVGEPVLSTDTKLVRIGDGGSHAAISPLADREYTDDQDAITLASAKTYTNTEISSLIDGAPDALNTLNEIASALDDNPNIVDVLEKVISVGEINNVSGTKNNWDLESLGSNFIKINPNGALTVTGISSAYSHKKFTIVNSSSSYNITLVSQAGASQSGNKLRFLEGVGVVLEPSEKTDFIYDNVDEEWIVIKHGVSSNTRPVIDSGETEVSGVYNMVVISSAAYTNLQNNNDTDPNTIYFVP